MQQEYLLTKRFLMIWHYIGIFSPVNVKFKVFMFTGWTFLPYVPISKWLCDWFEQGDQGDVWARKEFWKKTEKHKNPWPKIGEVARIQHNENIFHSYSHM